jgi:hypothetical protein
MNGAHSTMKISGIVVKKVEFSSRVISNRGPCAVTGKQGSFVAHEVLCCERIGISIAISF